MQLLMSCRHDEEPKQYTVEPCRRSRFIECPTEVFVETVPASWKTAGTRVLSICAGVFSVGSEKLSMGLAALLVVGICLPVGPEGGVRMLNDLDTSRL